MGVSGASAGSGRAARALRLLLLLVLGLAAIEFICGSVLDSSPLRTYIYTPVYNATQASARSDKITPPWPKRVLAEPTKVVVEIVTLPIRNHTQAPFHNSSMDRNDTEEVPATNSVATALVKSKKPIAKKRIAKKPVAKKPAPNKQKYTKTTDKNACPEEPPSLGPIKVNKTEIFSLEWVEKQHPNVSIGGWYKPPNCTARHRVAIIVPYRDREEHLALFLHHMHPFLMKQQLEYGIFIIEQSGDEPFNRAKLMNVGFVESQRVAGEGAGGGWQCFVFHDIDLLPMDTRNMYTCPRQPRHMSAAVDTLKFQLPYESLFGGVSALTREQFLKVNGFSNKYWGWGGEDDDMTTRLKKNDYHIARYRMSIARYVMLTHTKALPNPKRFKLLRNTKSNYKNDGLSTLEYELVKVAQHHLYTHILVNIDERS